MRLSLSGILLSTMVVVGAASACTGGPAPVEEQVKATPPPQKPLRQYYTLRSGDPVVSESNLPARTDVYVDWHYDDGSTETYTGFRGWDFAGDGHYGMLEVLDENGLPQHYIFDFLGDGHPQWQVEVDGLR